MILFIIHRWLLIYFHLYGKQHTYNQCQKGRYFKSFELSSNSKCFWAVESYGNNYQFLTFKLFRVRQSDFRSSIWTRWSYDLLNNCKVEVVLDDAILGLYTINEGVPQSSVKFCPVSDSFYNFHKWQSQCWILKSLFSQNSLFSKF